MKKSYFTSIWLSCILFSSCYSYKVFPKEYRELENNNNKPIAFIVNNSLKKEYDILVHSDLFTITPDSGQADINIVIHPLERRPSCGQAFVASVFTLGQLPVYYTDRYIYRFDEIKSSIVTERELELKIARRSWFWDVFVFNKKFEQNAGKALLGEYQNL